MNDPRQARKEAAESSAKALIESLADLLDVPNSGKWYQISAYVKCDPEGTTTVQNLGAFPIHSGRTLRLIDEMTRATDAATPL